MTEKHMQKSGSRMKMIIAIILVVLVLAGLLIAWLVISHHKGDSSIARIYRDQQVVHEVDLDTVTDSYTYRVESEGGHYNVFLIEKGKISCIEADCPDKICVKTGTIDSDMVPITCLPHKVIAKIEAE